MTAPALALLVTALLLAGLLLLGLSLQLGWRKDRARWPHHALFFAVTVSFLVTLLVFWRSGENLWPLLPALLLLLSMPLTRPGQGNHWQRALLVALTFVGGALVSLR